MEMWSQISGKKVNVSTKVLLEKRSKTKNNLKLKIIKNMHYLCWLIGTKLVFFFVNFCDHILSRST